MAVVRPNHNTADLHNDALVHSQVKKSKVTKTSNITLLVDNNAPSSNCSYWLLLHILLM